MFAFMATSLLYSIKYLSLTAGLSSATLCAVQKECKKGQYTGYRTKIVFKIANEIFTYAKYTTKVDIIPIEVCKISYTMSSICRFHGAQSHRYY